MNHMHRSATCLLVVCALAAVAVAGKKAIRDIQVTGGEMLDPRDGTVYNTVTIGGQRWMAKNMNFKTDSSWCYENAPDSCRKYGRLYAWNAARKACPSGWHLPSDDEWWTLEDMVGGKEKGGRNLKSADGWVDSGGGTDKYRFTALPAGIRKDDDGFSGVDSFDFYWSATEDGDWNAWGPSLSSFVPEVYGGPGAKSNGLSVRCLENPPRRPPKRRP